MTTQNEDVSSSKEADATGKNDVPANVNAKESPSSTPAATGAAGTMTIQLTVTALPGAPRIPLDLATSNDTTVALTSSELRQLVSTKTNIPLSSLRLIYRGRLITDSATNITGGTAANVITEYKLENGSVLHCMGKPSSASETKKETAEDTLSSTTTLPVVANSTNTTPATASATTTAPPVTATSTAASSIPSSSLSVPSLQSALDAMRASNASTIYAKCVKTLQKVLLNIIDHPLEEKYRTIKVNNAAFQKHFLHVHNSTTVLLACGFHRIHENTENAAYTMDATPDQWPTLVQSKATVDRAVQQTILTTPSSTSTAATGLDMTRAGGGSTLPFPPAGGIMPDPSTLQQHIANVMSNPQQLQAMMQDPMVQNMIRNDPQLANIPNLQQAMDEMMTNPQVAEAMRQMMSDPNYQRMLSSPEYVQIMQQRFQQSLSGARGSEPPPLFPPNLFAQPPTGSTTQQQRPSSSPWGTAPTAPTTTNNNTTTRTDDELTEEEMIAEAIRRSLQDNNNSGP